MYPPYEKKSLNKYVYTWVGCYRTTVKYRLSSKIYTKMSKSVCTNMVYGLFTPCMYTYTNNLGILATSLLLITQRASVFVYVCVCVWPWTPPGLQPYF